LLTPLISSTYVYRGVSGNWPVAASVAVVGVGTPRLRQVREHCRALAGELSVMGGLGVCDEKGLELRPPVCGGSALIAEDAMSRARGTGGI